MYQGVATTSVALEMGWNLTFPMQLEMSAKITGGQQ